MAGRRRGAASLRAALGVLALAALGLAGLSGPARAAEAGGFFSEPQDAPQQTAAGWAAWSGPEIGGLEVADGAAGPAQPGGPQVESLFSADYARLLWRDTCHVVTAPARWDLTDWEIAAAASAVLVGAALFVDEDLARAIQRNRNSGTDAVARDFKPFGAEYSFIILAGFEIEGLIFDDDESRAVAQDGLAASIIAGGITEGLKRSAGRSRPDQDRGAHHFELFGPDHGFPSGHVTQAFAVATVVSEHYDSLAVDIGGYGLAALSGYSRLESNSHYASDVLAGALIGTAVGRTVTAFNKSERWGIGPSADEHGLGLTLIVRF